VATAADAADAPENACVRLRTAGSGAQARPKPEDRSLKPVIENAVVTTTSDLKSGNSEDRRSVPLRLSVLQWTVGVIFMCLAAAFWYLQVIQYEHFRELAENNHQRTLALRAPRGMLFDRTGRPLVENRHGFNISLVREQARDIPGTLQKLAEIAGADEAALRDAVQRHEREPRYRPIVLIPDASMEQVTAVLARRVELPALMVEQVPTRNYPDAALAAHLFGYVGEVTEAQLARAGNDLQSGDLVGQAGLELMYNQLLMGENGARRVVVNSAGREIRTLEEEPPSEGKRLQLTLDYDVQRAAEDGFKGLGYNGAAVVLDPRNGEVLAFTSVPAYDPNAFAAGIDRRTWAALNTNALRPLQDRAIQGRYSPGSTFKMAVATAALEEGLITPDFRVHCAGGANFYGRTFRCWKRGGHGSVNLRQAIEQSCDVFFYTVGNMLGVDRIHKWSVALGLGVKSGLDLPNEVLGIVPSTAWKKAKTGEKWYAGETISVSIGQGQVTVTPVSMAVYMATLANGGTRVTPHLLKAVDDGHGWKPVPAPPPQGTVTMRPETIKAVHDGMWMVVNGAGTGGNARLVGYDVSGKTGTAQVISLEAARALRGRTDLDLRDNGWFVFFAPRDNPEIAGVVFAEHGEHGTNAAIIARHIMATFFAKRDGNPLPTFQWPLRPAAPPRPPPAPATIATGTTASPQAGGAF
jgi:penicillin-binding protein 2